MPPESIVYPRCTADPNVIEAIVRKQAARLGSPASDRDIRSMVDHIARWMREEWKGPLDGVTRGRERDVDAGVMTREAEASGRLVEWRAFEFAERRQAAGSRSRGIVAGKTNQRLADDALAMLADGTAITQVALATKSGVSLRTVRRCRPAAAAAARPCVWRSKAPRGHRGTCVGTGSFTTPSCCAFGDRQ